MGKILETFVWNTNRMMYFYKIHEPNSSVNVYGARTDTIKQMITDNKYSHTVSDGGCRKWHQILHFQAGFV